MPTYVPVDYDPFETKVAGKFDERVPQGNPASPVLPPPAPLLAPNLGNIPASMSQAPPAAQIQHRYPPSDSLFAPTYVPVDYDPFEVAATRQRQSVRPNPGRKEGALTQLQEDLVIPKAPLDAALLFAGGPAGKIAKMAAVAGGAALSSDDAQAGVFNTIRKGIRAYHGSPHDFDRFDISKIGTGEGAQSYGHGLYFAENPKVAESYKHTQQHPFGLTNPLVAPPKGHMYEVNINAKPEQFLDWDKPLVTQHEPTMNRLLQRVPDETKRILDRGTRGQDLHAYLGGDVPKNEPVKEGVTRILREGGIPGIKYLDQGSRFGGRNRVMPHSDMDGNTHAVISGTGQRLGVFKTKQEADEFAAGKLTNNYVLFDDKIIDILKKYGIAGLLGAGGSTAFQDQSKAQSLQELAQ